VAGRAFLLAWLAADWPRNRDRRSRKNERRASFPAPDDLPEQALPPRSARPPRWRAIEYRSPVIPAGGQLPQVQKQVVYERFVEQRSIREIAQRLGKTPGAVKQLQLRGGAKSAGADGGRPWLSASPRPCKLDEVVQAMLVSLQPAAGKKYRPARKLRRTDACGGGGCASFRREEFRVALKNDLQRRASMRRSHGQRQKQRRGRRKARETTLYCGQD